MSISYAVWGVIFGWILSPRWRGFNKQGLLSSLSYLAAVFIATGMSLKLNFHSQSRLFVVGMFAQFFVFLLVVFLKRLFARTTEKS